MTSDDRLRSAALFSVPELTCGAGIKLNARVSLRRRPRALSIAARDLPKVRKSPGQSPRTIVRRLAAYTRNDNQEPCQFADVGLEREAGVGSNMAFVDGDYAAAIDHGPPCLWKSLAASRWPPLDLQKIHRVIVRAIRVPAATGHLFLHWNCIFDWRPRLANASLGGLAQSIKSDAPQGLFHAAGSACVSQYCDPAAAASLLDTRSIRGL